MAEYWKRVGQYGASGVLWLDPDVAADPDDVGSMVRAIAAGPDRMYTGMVKLWPESTGRNEWIWSHRPGTLGSPVATQDETTDAAYVATGFLYTPGGLLNLCLTQLETAQWAEVDVLLSETALMHGIESVALLDCRPKHLHF